MNKSAADLIAEATLPCHHRREPFGPCETCLEDVVEQATSGLIDLHEGDLTSLKEEHDVDVQEREADKANIEQMLDASTSALTSLIESVRDVRGAVANSTKEYIEQQLDAVADKAEVAT